MRHRRLNQRVLSEACKNRACLTSSSDGGEKGDKSDPSERPTGLPVSQVFEAGCVPGSPGACDPPRDPALGYGREIGYTILDIAKGFIPLLRLPDAWDAYKRGNYFNASIILAGELPGPKQIKGVANAMGVVRRYGSGRPPHTATVKVVRDGRVVSEKTYQSGSMTADERAMGFPKGQQASHTENRAMRDGEFSSGDKVIIEGQYEPCKTCKGAMNKTARSSGAEITYS